MKKSVSVKDELAYKAMDQIYIRNARNPQKPTSFSQIVNEALEMYLLSKVEGVNVCKK